MTLFEGIKNCETLCCKKRIVYHCLQLDSFQYHRQTNLGVTITILVYTRNNICIMFDKMRCNRIQAQDENMNFVKNLNSTETGCSSGIGSTVIQVRFVFVKLKGKVILFLTVN